MKFVCFSGKAQAGKTTSAIILADQLRKHGYRVVVTSYAGLVKYICKAFFNWDGQKDERGRTLLQYVGTDIVRTKQPDYWVDFIIDMADFFGDAWDFVIIDDARFPNEISKIRSAGHEVLHVMVVRPGYDNGLTAEQSQHPSETSLNGIRPDVLTVNSDDKWFLEGSIFWGITTLLIPHISVDDYEKYSK